jgi:hypothetical protein
MPERGTASAAPAEPTAPRVAWLEDRFQTEAYDAPWATGMADRVEAALELEEFAGTALVVVACQFTLCRLDLEHADAAAERQFLQTFVSKLGLGDLESLATHSAAPDGTRSMTVYLSRDGHRLAQ